jgi:hypothetical protein
MPRPLRIEYAGAWGRGREIIPTPGNSASSVGIHGALSALFIPEDEFGRDWPETWRGQRVGIKSESEAVGGCAGGGFSSAAELPKAIKGADVEFKSIVKV